MHGIQFENPLDPGFFDDFSTHAFYAAEMKNFINHATRFNCMIDIGSCFGLFSLIFAANIGKTSYAIEPSQWAYPNLLTMIAANPTFNIKSHNLFFGSVIGRKVQCVKDWCQTIAIHKGIVDRVGECAEKTIVEETSLDNFCQAQKIKPDCMKIDVEGYELEVVIGGQETISSYHPVIFLEVHVPSIKELGGSIEDLTVLLERHNYKIYDTDNEVVDMRYSQPNNHYHCEVN